jgi:adenylate cyclase
MPPVRHLTAILAADVAGYSRLMGADEEGTHERLKAHLRELIEPKIAEHRGRVVKNTGDGFLAEYPSVVDAVRCAVEVQRGMAEANAATPPEKRIEFRVGINLGDVIAERDDIYGDGVNIAARLEALAEPGGVCISRVVRDQIRDKLPYAFEDNGEQSVKNIARPVRAFALRPETIAAMPMPDAAPIREVPISARRRRSIVPPIGDGCNSARHRRRGLVGVAGDEIPSVIRCRRGQLSCSAPRRPRLSIVVLPFVNLSNDPDQQCFADACEGAPGIPGNWPPSSSTRTSGVSGCAMAASVLSRAARRTSSTQAAGPSEGVGRRVRIRLAPAASLSPQ